jgi:hypothetical protein
MKPDQQGSAATDLSPRRAALVAGLGLLLMAIIAPVVEFGTLQRLIDPGDAGATAANILASGAQFRAAIAGFLVVAALDVVVAWALYVLFKAGSPALSMLAAWFRLVYAAILAASLVPLAHTLRLLGGAAYLGAFQPEQLQAQALLSASAFRDGWNIGLAIFGLHLMVLGYVAFRSGFVPKWMGVLLLLAGLGYLVDSLGTLLVADYALGIAQYTFIGEVLFMFWLLWKGIRGLDPEAAPK